jgi:hypothetical protein
MNWPSLLSSLYPQVIGLEARTLNLGEALGSKTFAALKALMDISQYICRAPPYTEFSLC